MKKNRLSTLHKLQCLIIILGKLIFTSQTYAGNEIDSALSILSTQKLDSNKVNTLNFLCWKYSDLGQNEKTLQYANEAVRIAEKINFKRGERAARNEIAIVYINTAAYEKAIMELNKTISLALKINDSVSAAKALVNMGNVYNRMSNYTLSLDYYQQALAIFEKLNQAYATAFIYNLIGTIYLDFKEPSIGEKYFKKALKIRTDINDEAGIGETQANLGSLYFKVKKKSLAKHHAMEALKLLEVLDDKRYMAKTLMIIGRIYEYENKTDSAIFYIEKAKKISLEFNDTPEYVKALINLSFIYINLKNYQKAKTLLTEALPLAINTGEKELLRNIYNGLSESEEGLGNYKVSLEYQKKYKAYTDSIFNIDNSNSLSELKTLYEVDKKESELKTLNRIEQAKKDAQIQRQKTLRNAFVLGFILMIALAFTIYRSYLQKEKANQLIAKQKQEVEQQKEIVEHQNEEILSSITYAKRIQSTILPPQKVVKSYLDNSFILYLPKDIVAGDFYWMETVQLADEPIREIENGKEAKNNQRINSSAHQLILFAACDCTGHGVPGALVSVVCSNALNRVVKEYRITKPAQILDKVAEIVVNDFSKDENENVQDGMDISFCALNKEKRILYWAGANNPLWIVRNGNLIEYKADKQPVGKYDGIKPFTNHEIPLEINDTLYLFTDGFADQFGGEKNKKLTKARFKEILININNLRLEEQHQYLLDFLNEFKGSNEQVDDILVMGVKINGIV